MEWPEDERLITYVSKLQHPASQKFCQALSKREAGTQQAEIPELRRDATLLMRRRHSWETPRDDGRRSFFSDEDDDSSGDAADACSRVLARAISSYTSLFLL